jgi:hypothetical protein
LKFESREFGSCAPTPSATRTPFEGQPPLSEGNFVCPAKQGLRTKKTRAWVIHERFESGSPQASVTLISALLIRPHESANSCSRKQGTSDSQADVYRTSVSLRNETMRPTTGHSDYLLPVFRGNHGKQALQNCLHSPFAVGPLCGEIHHCQPHRQRMHELYLLIGGIEMKIFQQLSQP